VWIDASRSVIALLDREIPEEAKAYLFWIANAEADQTQPRHPLRAERRTREGATEVAALKGYAGSLPPQRRSRAASARQLGLRRRRGLAFADRPGDYRDLGVSARLPASPPRTGAEQTTASENP
jgi:hypothetical protein